MSRAFSTLDQREFMGGDDDDIRVQGDGEGCDVVDKVEPKSDMYLFRCGEIQ